MKGHKGLRVRRVSRESRERQGARAYRDLGEPIAGTWMGMEWMTRKRISIMTECGMHWIAKDRKVTRVSRGLKETREIPVTRDHRATRDLPGQPEQPALREPKGTKEIRVTREIPVIPDHRDQKVIREIRESG
jgi:hypothetical protein